MIFWNLALNCLQISNCKYSVLLSSSLSWFSRILIDGAPIRRQVSSANKHGVQLTLLGISLIYSKKRRSKDEALRTSIAINFKEELVLLIVTY